MTQSQGYETRIEEKREVGFVKDARGKCRVYRGYDTWINGSGEGHGLVGRDCSLQ